MKLKIVFSVEDAETNEVIVPKSQSILLLDGNQWSTVENLARDHLAEQLDLTALAKDSDSGVMTDEQKALHKDISISKAYLDELFMAQGDIIRRFLRVKLREWAQKQSKVPA